MFSTYKYKYIYIYIQYIQPSALKGLEAVQKPAAGCRGFMSDGTAWRVVRVAVGSSFRLKVQGSGFKGLEFRVRGLGFSA